MMIGHPPREAEGVRLLEEPGAGGTPPARSTQSADLSISRVKLRRDFLAANSGIRVPMPAFILLVKPTGLGEARAGFTVSKKVGNAVVRNRARRRLKEAARMVMPGAAVPSADHIFIARRMGAERPFAALLDDTRTALVKARRKLAA